LKRWPNARKAAGVNRTQATAAIIATTVGVAALFGLAACPGSPSTTLYTPITGLVINSESLLSGIGCGTAPGQVYKYAAVVTLAGDASEPGLPVSGVFDCFTNAQFANLATPDGNLTSYDIAIYAFNEASFPAAELGGCDNLESDASCQGENPTTVLKYAGMANWTTTCTATQVPGVSEVAVCNSLRPVGDASVGSDEGTDTSAPEGGDGGAGDAGGDAGDAGNAGADGGAPEGAAPGEAGVSEAGDAGSEPG
jgi:hypothetical protein